MVIVAPGIKVLTDHKFVLAADLGQSTDPTALCVMEQVISNEVTWRGREKPAGTEFRVRYLQRLPLGMSYVDQVRHVMTLMSRPPLAKDGELIIDETGVGRPVGDLFNLSNIRPIRITITAGEKQSSHGSSRWHVPKGLLISALDARLHCGEVKISPDLPEANTLREELRDFRRHISTAGRYSFEARTGKHDDLVLALALALWSFVGRPKRQAPMVGRYSQNGNVTWENNQ